MARPPVVTIDSVDVGPPDLPAQLPRPARLVRMLPGPDRDGYALAALAHPLTFRTTRAELAAGTFDLDRLPRLDPQTVREDPDGGLELLVYAVALVPRLVGQQLHPTMAGFPVALAYVLDPAQMSEPTLDLAAVHYAAVALVSVVDDGS